MVEEIEDEDSTCKTEGGFSGLGKLHFVMPDNKCIFNCPSILICSDISFSFKNVVT